jgi:outer membrane lipoprotein-sorting protein
MILPSLLIFSILSAGVGVENPTIIKLNEQNSKLLTMTCDLYNYGSKSENGPVARSRGQIYFQKPRNLRMINHGDRIDKRLMLDLGSNDDVFWFFARRLKPPTLKYSKYTDLDRTNLDNSLNPLLMMELLGLNTINKENIKIVENDKQISVYYNMVAPNGKKTTKITIINKKLLLIAGHLIYDEKNELVSQAIVSNVTKISTMNIPSQINIVWNKKDIDITILLSNIKLNVQIDNSIFIMPNIKPSENLAR